jgi:hypothetical protein
LPARSKELLGVGQPLAQPVPALLAARALHIAEIEIDPAVKPLLPDFSGAPAVTVREVLQTETIDPEGYRYAAPGQP